jgi:hypothetical protein
MTSDISSSLRLALSHREKTQGLLAQYAAAFDALKIDAARYKTMQRRLHAHLAKAETAIQSIRADERQHLVQLEEQVRDRRAQQAGLSEKLLKGKISTTRANKQNRKISTALDALLTQIAACNTLLTAESSQDLGGLIDLPMEDYIDAGNAKTSSENTRITTIVVLVAALIAAISVFLPWFRIEAIGNVSMFGSGAIYTELGIASAAWSNSQFIVALLMLSLAAAGAGMTAVSSAHRFGWGLIVVGTSLLFAAVFPAVLLAYHLRLTDVTLLSVLTWLRIGAYLYAAGGIAMVIVGSRRLRMTEGAVRTTPRGVATLAAAAVIVVLLAGWLLSGVPPVESVEFSARRTDPRSGNVQVRCENLGKEAIDIYLPWPGGQPDGIPLANPALAYGVSVYVRGQGSDAFRLYPNGESAWNHLTLLKQEDGAISLGPRRSANVVFNLRSIGLSGEAPAAIRLAYSNGRGDATTLFETELKESYRAQPIQVSSRPIARPDRASLPSIPVHKPPPAQRPSVADSAAPAPASIPVQRAPQAAALAERSTAPQQPQRAPLAYVKFTGIIGDKLAVSLHRAGEERPKQQTMRIGDRVAGAWVIDSVQDSPKALLLLNRGSRQRVVLERGQSKPLYSAADRR